MKRNCIRFFYIFYNVLFFFLSIIAVYIAFLDFSSLCPSYLRTVDIAITAIFFVDYFSRLLLSEDKALFFRQNILDFIAIIPFSSIFKFFRILKILKLVKLLKLFRLSAYFLRFYKKVKFFLDLNGLKYVLFLCIICIGSGGIAIHYAEGMSFPDGLWWSFVTATTVGYGDISPSTPFGRIIASILMVVGIGLIGSLTSTITALFFSKKESASLSVQDEVVHNIQSQLDDFDNLSIDDVDSICCILKSLKSNEEH